MKNWIINCTRIGLIFLIALTSCKKEGCTDVNAINYDPNAKSNPDLCIYETLTDTLTGSTTENLPVLITGTFNFVDDGIIMEYKGVSDYYDENDNFNPEVFGESNPGGRHVLVSTTEFYDEEPIASIIFYLEHEFPQSLFGEYSIIFQEHYMYIYSLIVLQVNLEGEALSISFPSGNSYYQNLDTPITEYEGGIFMNFKEPEPNESLTDFSGEIETVFYYDEEITFNDNAEEVRIYHKKVIVNLAFEGKIRLF